MTSTISSGSTKRPSTFMVWFTFFPSLVSVLAISRSSLPAPITMSPNFLPKSSACVSLPDPCGPKITKLETFIIAHQKLRFNLFHGLNHHGHHDQEAGTADGQRRRFGDNLHQKRQDGNEPQKYGSG